MIEALKARKEQLEAQGKKGFTLMEMLIVIAIIAVLIAIAIPVFTAQLEKSREATDAANIRAAYAEVMADGISGKTGSITKEVVITQQENGWQNGDIKLPDNLTPSDFSPEKDSTVVITYTDSGATIAKKTE